MKKFLFIAAALLLVSCSGSEKPMGPSCPQAGLLQGSDILPIFAEDVSKDGLRVLGSIQNFRGACRYKKDGGADFHLELDFAAKKFAKAGDLKGLKLPYFIAVLSPDETVLQKESFWIKIDFDNKQAVTEKEVHDIKVPVSSVAAGGNYKIVFGFELTKEQLDFNRGKNPR